MPRISTLQHDSHSDRRRSRRDERLAFFVHDAVDGEGDLLPEVESALGRGVLASDVREAAYREALRDQDDVLDEPPETRYALDEHREEPMRFTVQFLSYSP